MIAFDDPGLRARVTEIETETEAFAGVDLGSIWTVRGEVREDTYGSLAWLERQLVDAGWWVGCVESVTNGDSSRDFFAARVPTIRVYLTHLGEGDEHLLGSVPIERARAAVRALNGRAALTPEDAPLVAAARAAHAAWLRRPGAEGAPYCYAVPEAGGERRSACRIDGLLPGEELPTGFRGW